MSELEKKLDNLLAEEFGISPEEVTCEYIHNWREKKLYPNCSYEVDSINGGYMPHTSHILSNEELEKIQERANIFLDKFSENTNQ